MKVNRAGEIESKFGVNFNSLTDFTDFTDMEPWAALGLESKFGGNIRVNIL